MYDGPSMKEQIKNFSPPYFGRRKYIYFFSRSLGFSNKAACYSMHVFSGRVSNKGNAESFFNQNYLSWYTHTAWENDVVILPLQQAMKCYPFGFIYLPMAKVS